MRYYYDEGYSPFMIDRAIGPRWRIQSDIEPSVVAYCFTEDDAVTVVEALNAQEIKGPKTNAKVLQLVKK